MGDTHVRIRMLRKASTCLTVFALVFCTGVSAAPDVNFKATFVPVPGFPRTGNFSGTGAAIQLEYQISGTEYGGSPPPLVAMSLYLPEGTTLHTAGFSTCTRKTLEQAGPPGCSSSAAAGPVGSASGIVSFGAERVAEAATVQSFTAPGGGILFFVTGRVPASYESLAGGDFVDLGGAGGYGPELVAEIPLISTVPGAPFASLEALTATFGPAYTATEGPVYYITVPTTCPNEAGLQFKSQLVFDEEGASPINPEGVTSTYRSPCPHMAPVESEAPRPSTSSSGTSGTVGAPSRGQTPAPQPLPSSSARLMVTANTRACVSHHGLRIHVQRLHGLTYREVIVYINRRRFRILRKVRHGVTIDLHDLPRGRYTIKIVALTSAGSRLTWAQTYRACASEPVARQPKK